MPRGNIELVRTILELQGGDRWDQGRQVDLRTGDEKGLRACDVKRDLVMNRRG